MHTPRTEVYRSTAVRNTLCCTAFDTNTHTRTLHHRPLLCLSLWFVCFLFTMANRSLSNRMDGFIAYLVGEQRTNAAVACALRVEKLKHQGGFEKYMLESRGTRVCRNGGVACSPVSCTSTPPCAFYSAGPHGGKSGVDLFKEGRTLWQSARAAMMAAMAGTV